MEKLIGIIGVIVIIALLCAFPVMWLWNWLMPKIFGLIEITFWQSLGLITLSEILFKTHNQKSKL